MIIVPEESDFINDHYSIDLGSYKIVFNAINESLAYGSISVDVNEIYVFAEATIDGKFASVPCPNKIGLSNEFVSIESDDLSIQGASISLSNLGKWRVVIFEQL